MTALGFREKEEHHHGKGSLRGGQSRAEAMVNAIVGDGKVTLEEFSALMTGENSGQDPYDIARTVFSVLSRPDMDHMNDGLITLNKLEATCQEYMVWAMFPVRFSL
jgi:hypothetical protein